MRYLVMPSNDIRHNLATEQYLMSKTDLEVPFMLFYIEEPCVVVGRNQNLAEEINQKYCQENNVTVTRRLSGGGTMYQDTGNLCFSFVVPADKQKFGDFASLVQPIVDALHDMGATGAQVNGRNDLVIDGKKFSGNAMYTKHGRTFSHGTLMFDMQADNVAKALTVPADKIASKGIKSVRSRVTNIKPYLKPEFQNLNTYQFRDELIKRIFKVNSIEEAQAKYEFKMDEEDQQAVDQLVADIYGNWDWVYGKSPKFTIQKRKHFPAGTIDARFLVEHGMISNVKIYGDFFGKKNVEDLQIALKGQKYTPSAIEKVLRAFDLSEYFLNVDSDQIIEFMC